MRLFRFVQPDGGVCQHDECFGVGPDVQGFLEAFFGVNPFPDMRGADAVIFEYVEVVW